MGLEKINILEQVADLKVLSEELAKLQRTMRYLLNGNLSFENIQVGGIRAENIDVNKLSAIVADIGEVTAGILRSVAIYGSFFATAEEGYPRIEISGDNKYIKLFLNADIYLEIIHEGEEGFPQINFVRNGQAVRLGHGMLSPVNPGDASYPGLISTSPFAMFAFGGLYLPGIVNFTDWSFLVNSTTSKTLQQELQELRLEITSINNSISTLTTELNNKADKETSTSSAGSHNHGIADGTTLLTPSGTVTWSSASSHSHTQK